MSSLADVDETGLHDVDGLERLVSLSSWVLRAHFRSHCLWKARVELMAREAISSTISSGRPLTSPASDTMELTLPLFSVIPSCCGAFQLSHYHPLMRFRVSCDNGLVKY